MNNTREHQKLVGEIMLAFGSLPYCRVFPRRVGLAVPIGSNNPIYFGFKGEADIQGILTLFVSGRKIGIFLAIEVKTGSGKLSKEQALWRDMVLAFGGIYIEARSVEQALQDLKSVVQSFQGSCEKF